MWLLKEKDYKDFAMPLKKIKFNSTGLPMSCYIKYIGWAGFYATFDVNRAF